MRLQRSQYCLFPFLSALQRSHTRRCGYNQYDLEIEEYPVRASKEPHPKVRLQPYGFPFGVGTGLLQRSHTRRCGYNLNWIGGIFCFRASKEPHPKVRLQRNSHSLPSENPPLQRSHTRRCGYNCWVLEALMYLIFKVQFREPPQECHLSD